MKHYFLLIIIITHFPIVSFGFSLIPTRINLGFINSYNKITSVKTRLSEKDRDLVGEEIYYNVCFEYDSNPKPSEDDICRYKNGKPYSQRNHLYDGIPINFTFGYEPFYFFSTNFGIRFQLIYRNMNSRMMDYPKRDISTKIEYRKINIAAPFIFVFGDKSMGRKGYQFSFLIGYGPSTNLFENTNLSNSYGSLKPSNLLGSVLNMEIRYGSFFLISENSFSRYEIPKSTLGNTKNDILTFTDTDTNLGFTIYF